MMPVHDRQEQEAWGIWLGCLPTTLFCSRLEATLFCSHLEATLWHSSHSSQGADNKQNKARTEVGSHSVHRLQLSQKTHNPCQASALMCNNPPALLLLWCL